MCDGSTTLNEKLHNDSESMLMLKWGVHILNWKREKQHNVQAHNDNMYSEKKKKMNSYNQISKRANAQLKVCTY